MPISSILFSLSLVLGTITSLTAPNWLIAWLGMEMNLLSFIPLTTFHPLGPVSEKTSSACKYFIAQAAGSVLFLIGPALWATPWSPLAPMFIAVALMTKAGMAPMFQWFPSTIASLNWLPASTLLTWQKLTPLLILFSMDMPQTMLTPLLLLAGLNALVGGINGLAQTQLRPLLAFSSITHMGWMVALSTMSSTAATGYLLCYVMMVLPLLLILLNSRSTSPKTIPCLKTLSPAQLAMSATLLLNLAGLPPLGGFCLKAASLAMLASSAPLVSLVLIMSSVATLGFYINITLLTLISPFESAAPSLVKPPYSSSLVIAGTLGALALPAIPLVLF